MIVVVVVAVSDGSGESGAENSVEKRTAAASSVRILQVRGMRLWTGAHHFVIHNFGALKSSRLLSECKQQT